MLSTHSLRCILDVCIWCLHISQVQAGYVRATQRPTASISLALTLPVDGSLALRHSLQQQQQQPQRPFGSGGASADGLSPETRVYRYEQAPPSTAGAISLWTVCTS